MLARQMAELMRDVDMYLPTWDRDIYADVRLNAQTGHPCAVVPYAFGAPPTPMFEIESGGTKPAIYSAQPLCAVLVGKPYEDDKLANLPAATYDHVALRRRVRRSGRYAKAQ